MRTLFRPTAFVDSPFGLDVKVARLAGGMCWFSAVEAIAWDGEKRLSADLVGVERMSEWIEDRPDDEQLAWQRLTGHRPPLQLGERIVRLDQPQVMGIVNVTPDSFSDGGQFANAGSAAEAGSGMAAAEQQSSMSAASRPGPARRTSGRATRSSASCR